MRWPQDFSQTSFVILRMTVPSYLEVPTYTPNVVQLQTYREQALERVRESTRNEILRKSGLTLGFAGVALMIATVIV